MEIILLLLEIIGIIMAPRVSRSLMPYLRVQILHFLELFKTLFPLVNPINKMHHLSHYPEAMIFSGPMRDFFCARFEAKHAVLKEKAKSMHNFRNAPMTVVRVSQAGQSSKWGAGDVEVNQYERQFVPRRLPSPPLHELPVYIYRKNLGPPRTSAFSRKFLRFLSIY